MWDEPSQTKAEQQRIQRKSKIKCTGRISPWPKRVIMIDDSIVRGTTSDRIVNMLKEAGATEVHVRISSPPFLWPCYFGTDIPEREQLIAYNRTIEDIRKIIGADSLGYLKIERLEQLVGGLPICKGCFTGKYPMEPPKEDIRGEYER